ncbi:MAG: glycosyltransferase N-terminal domain-containing protein, partial [Bacteroidota bacterium]
TASRQPLIWMHCASLGEFEQGRTVLEALKKQRPDWKILLTFFSPSGYEIRKNYPGADWIFYLPADGRKNARRFLSIVQPTVAIFVKYEFWMHYLAELKNQAIPTFLIAAVFRKSQPFFQWYGGLHREMLGCFTKIFVQNEASRKLLESIKMNQVEVAGDSRVDRVLEIAAQLKSFPTVEKFCTGAPVLVCGSTWQADEDILCKFINRQAGSEWKFIIAPHDVQTARIQQVEKKLKLPFARFSQLERLETNALTHFRVLLIDNIGMLAWLYQFGKVAYVGGGFGKGIHNTLEPIAFGLPVVFGQNYKKFEEAKSLVETGGGFPIGSPEEFEAIMKKLSKPENWQAASDQATGYLKKNQGATKKVMKELLDAVGRKENEKA